MKFSEIPYARPDMDELKKEAETIIAALKSAESVEKAKEAVERMTVLMRHLSTAATIVEIRNSIDTRDEFYEKEREFFDEAMPAFQPVQMKWYEALLASAFRTELSAAYGNQLFELADISLKSFNEALIPLMVEENKLSSSYQKLIASAAVELDGKTYNLSGLRKLMQSPERGLRKKAYVAFASFFQEHEKELDDIYDRLVHIRHEKGIKAGYDSFIPLGYLLMGRQGYDAKDVAAFRQQVLEEIVPISRKLAKEQAARIGVDKLKFYDEAFMFPDGNAVPIGTKEELVEKAGRMYDELSPETGEFFRLMRENEMLDLETKPGKAAGGFCTDIADYDSPFIFSNFNGTSADVDVLTHEAGHAFQSYCTNKCFRLPEYAFPSSEGAEIHSMSMEFFTHPWMESFFGDRADRYRYAHTAEAILFIPYGVCVDEFQHRVFEKPDMTPEERKAVWYELEQKYLPDRDYDGAEVFEKGGFFFEKLHIFMLPFYYIDYCFASMAAFEFYGRMKTEREAAWKDYFRLCSLGGSKRYLDLLKEAKLSSPFEPGTVKRAVQPLLEDLGKEQR